MGKNKRYMIQRADIPESCWDLMNACARSLRCQYLYQQSYNAFLAPAGPRKPQPAHSSHLLQASFQFSISKVAPNLTSSWLLAGAGRPRDGSKRKHSIATGRSRKKNVVAQTKAGPSGRTKR